MDSQDDKKALFARRVQEALNVAGLTQKDIEDATGKQAAATVLRYVTGANLPRGDKLVELCTILKVTPNWLLGVDEWGVEFEDLKPTEPPGPTYADRLTAAAALVRSEIEPDNWGTRENWAGVDGDEVRFADLPGREPNALKLWSVLYNRPEEQWFMPPTDVMAAPGFQEFVNAMAPEDLTVGEARYLCEAITFYGGRTGSKHGRDPDFYRQRLAELRAAMDRPKEE